MEVIRDRDGNVIKSSRNLRGIREYVSNHIIETLSISPLSDGGGKLMILFSDRASYETNFASYGTLVLFVRQWRNVYGAPLMIGTESKGTVSYDNPALES